MKKLHAAFTFITAFLLYASNASAASDLERFILQNPGMVRRMLVGIIVLMGIAILASRIFFNRGIKERQSQKTGIAEEKKGGRPEKKLNLKAAKLIEIGGSRQYEIPLNSGLTMGRTFSNAVILKEPSVSRLHAKIVPEGEGYVLYDLGSKKGTFVNGEPIERHILRNSDIIEIGKEDFLFSYE